MWGYYGSKSKIVKYYPAPKYGTIIEPLVSSRGNKYQHKEVIWTNENL